MKKIAIFMLIATPSLVVGQSIVGDWQVTKQTNCLENEVTDTLKRDPALLEKFSSHSSPTSKVMIFHTDNSGEESIKEKTKKRDSSRKKFHYKFDGQNIYILDKKSHLIIDGFVLEQLTHDTLIYYTEGKECEKTFLTRIK